jgi:hypothetical protein
VTTVHVPKDKALATLLRGSGGHFEGMLNWMAGAADPDSGASTTVQVIGTTALAGVPGDLIALLLRARAAGHPAAEGVAGILRQLGAEVPEPEPAAEPVPVPAAKPEPPRPPLPPAKP